MCAVSKMNLAASGKERSSDALLEQFKSIKLSNDVMFGVVMRNKHLLEPLIRDILEIPDLELVGDVVIQSAQSFQSNQRVSIRFDVFCKSENRLINVEVQTTAETNIIKRARMYSSALDVQYQDTRKRTRGTHRYDLEDTFVIFLCSDKAFPFNTENAIVRGHTVYEDQFGNTLVDSDGRNYVFINYDTLHLRDYEHQYLQAVTQLMSFKVSSIDFGEVSEYGHDLVSAMNISCFTDKEVSLMLTAEEKARIREEERDEGRAEGRVETRDSLQTIIKALAEGASVEVIKKRFGVDDADISCAMNIIRFLKS